MLGSLVLSTLTSLATLAVQFRPLAPDAVPAAPPVEASSTALGCDDGSNGGTLVERQNHYFGNRFEAPCAAVHLVRASFVHAGPAQPDGARYRLHLLDADCREIGVTPELSTPAFGAGPEAVEVDLGAYGWCVAGPFALVLEPATCVADPSGEECYPALVVDASSDAAADQHCAVVSAPTADGRQCLAARSADGRFFDFRLRVWGDCLAAGCTSAVLPSTWSDLKRLYRDPNPAAAD